MNNGIKCLAIALILMFTAFDLYAAPGAPIKGVSVKGGKNPGGQMLVRATTDSSGNFSMDFSEGGEYRLVFDQQDTRNSVGERVAAVMQLDYTIHTPTDSARHTPFQNKIDREAIIITVPKGGGTIRGVLRSIDATSTAEPTQRAINEAGVSVKSTPDKKRPEN